MLASRGTWGTSWSRARPAASAAPSSTPCWRAATGCSRSIGSPAVAATCASSSWTRATPTRSTRRSPRAAADGYELRHVVAIAGAALPDEKACTDPAELPLDDVPRVAGAQPRHRVDHAAGGAAAPAPPHGRPLDRADHLDRRTRQLRAARVRRGEGRADRPRARARGEPRRRGHPHQRGGARRRADAAQRARVGARARAGTTACARACRSAGWGRPRTWRVRSSR